MSVKIRRQNATRILAYVEPVTFRFNAYELTPWVDWVARLVSMQGRHATAPSFAFASSPWLCDIFRKRVGNLDCQFFELMPKELLAPFGMDRHAYVADLFTEESAPVQAKELYKTFRDINRQFEPTVVISFSENRYIPLAFPGSMVLFGEMAPLPRSVGHKSLYFDPCGHQVGSLLVRHRNRILSAELPKCAVMQALCAWDCGFLQRMLALEDTKRLVMWRREHVGDAPLLLLALQPPDWPTQEGLEGRTPVDGVLMRWLAQLPPGWRAVVSYHPRFDISGATEDSIAQQFPALCRLPFGWRTGRSEWLLPHVDAVATVSSAIGIIAAISGKLVVANGRSNLASVSISSIMDLNHAAPLHPSERASLLAFLTNRYCHRFDDVVSNPGYMMDHILDLSQSDPAERCLDLDGWSPSRIQHFLEL